LKWQVFPGLPRLAKHETRHFQRFYEHLATEDDGHWQGETQCLRKNGEVFPVRESVRAVFGSDGNLSHYVAAITDISQLHPCRGKGQPSRLSISLITIRSPACRTACY